MALEHLKPHGKSTIGESIRDLPPRAQDLLRVALEVLSSLDKQKWPQLVSLATDAFESSYSVDEAELIKAINVSKEDARYLINAASFVIAMLAAHPEIDSKEFVTSLAEHKLISSDNKTSLKHLADFAEFVSQQRETLIEELEKNTLRNIVLPSSQSV